MVGRTDGNWTNADVSPGGGGWSRRLIRVCPISVRPSVHQPFLSSGMQGRRRKEHTQTTIWVFASRLPLSPQETVPHAANLVTKAPPCFRLYLPLLHHLASLFGKSGALCSPSFCLPLSPLFPHPHLPQGELTQRRKEGREREGAAKSTKTNPFFPFSRKFLERVMGGEGAIKGCLLDGN